MLPTSFSKAIIVLSLLASSAPAFADRAFKAPLCESTYTFIRLLDNPATDGKLREIAQQNVDISERISPGMTELCRAEIAAWEKDVERRKTAPSPRIGMTKKQVIEASSWGEPDHVNRTTSGAGVREQWVYDYGYLYFVNGKLTAIQD